MADFRVPPTQLPPLVVASTDYAFAASAVGAVENDYIVVFLQNNATAGTISEKTTSAWTLTTLNVTSGQRMAVAYLKVGASAPADVTFTANSGLWQAGYCVVFDADLTTFNAGTITTADGGSASSASTGALTPSSDNALVLYFAGIRNLSSATPMRFLPSDVVGELIQASDDATTFSAICVGTVQQTTAAATAKTFYATQASRCGSIVLPIKNAAGGKIAKHALASATKVLWLGTFGTAHDTGVTYGAPDNGGVTWDGAGNINGIPVSGTAATVDNGVNGPAPWGTFTTIASTVNTASAWVGTKATLAGAVDFTGKIFSLEHYFPQLAIQHGAEGTIVVFRDSSANWAAFQLSQKLGASINTLYVASIAVETATPYASGGTIVWTDVVSITFLGHRVSSTATSRTMGGFRNAILMGTTTLVGGNSTNPLEITYLNKALNGWGYQGLCKKLGPSISQNSKVQIGNASFPTYFDSSATMESFEGAYNKLSQREFNLTANAVELRLMPGASDTINLIASSIVADLQQDVVIDSGSNTGAALSVAGSAIVGTKFTDDAGFVLASGTFKDGNTVTLKNSASNLSVSRTVGAVPAVAMTANSKTLTDCTIDVTGTSATYHLSLSSAVTAITLNGVTLTGTPATDKIYSALASGTLTITTDGTGTALVAGDVTFVGGSTANAVIAAPQVYQEVAITGLAATYRLQIFDIEYDLTVSGITVTPTAGATYTHNGITWTVRSASITAGAGTITVYGTGTPAASGTLTKTGGTGDASVAFSGYAVDGTELYIGVPGATSYTWTDSVAAAAPRVIRVRVMEDGPGTSDAILMIDAIVGMCGITDGTESVGYLVAAVADDVYNDRGVDGSAITGITIDDTTLRLEIASGTITNFNGTDVLVVDGRDLYAYETYWLGTTAGMRDEARFIEAIDAVNFRCSNFKMKGTSGYPIMINNCFIVDAATGIFSSMVDYSGDPISNHPEHMKAIVVTTSDSVVTGTLAEFIAAVPTANDIAQEVVTGITF